MITYLQAAGYRNPDALSPIETRYSKKWPIRPFESSLLIDNS